MSKKIITFLVIVIALGVIWYFLSPAMKPTQSAPAPMPTETDKASVLENLSASASSTPPASVGKQVLNSLTSSSAASSTPSEDEKMKILQSLQGSH